MSQQIKIVKTLPELEALKESLADKEYVAFDTETSGITKESEIIGFSVACDDTTGYYVILSHWDAEAKEMVYGHTTYGAKDFLESLVGKKLIMHNAIFDCSMVQNNFGVDLMPSLHTDTMILGHLLDENRANGLKELGEAFFGENARKEQYEMKESVAKNGGSLTKTCYELYKADKDLLAKYGAKDAILTMKLFYVLVDELYNQGLEGFFYYDESMPMVRGPTYDLNTTGLLVDTKKLEILKRELEAECMEAEAFIMAEVKEYVKDKYPGTGKKNHFNVNSGGQRAWLLFERLGKDFHVLTREGKQLCKDLEIPIPYTNVAKRSWVELMRAKKGLIYRQSVFNDKTQKMAPAKCIRDVWMYLATGKDTMTIFAEKYRWAEKYLELAKKKKLLTTYVETILEKSQYNIIRPSFLQHGTSSGRYSSRKPNFQNLPRDDKRVKSCIIARPGKVFVGSDYSQLEPRVFASFSQDERLMKCFESGDDFYSVIGREVFDKFDSKPIKDGDPDAFGLKYPKLRNIAKVVALSSTYGTTAFKMAPTIGKSNEEAQEVIDSYFFKFPKVKELMLASHEQAKKDGVVYNLFGRPRRIPEALKITLNYGNKKHADLPYMARNILNLSINHRIQSTAASIMNRASIGVKNVCATLAKSDARWNDVKIVLQCHDSLILEGPEDLAETIVVVLQQCMEKTVVLSGVSLEAIPKIGKNLSEV